MSERINTTALELDEQDALSSENARDTVISIDHVSMRFNMASEQLTSFKEYALKLLKHELYFEEFTALQDISFDIKEGDVFGILGTNGSGKSTLLKIIAGVLEPSSGSVNVQGSIAPLIELGAGFDMELSARENIYLNGALLGYDKDFIEQHFDSIVEFAEIEKFLDMPMKNYSSGMVARIAFSIATVIIPDILIVDEVLSVGDFMFQRKCEDRIKTLIDQHDVTVLIVSHNNEQIARLCNRAAWIEKGHLRLIGNASDLCSIYGSLGGRTGSESSEQMIFDLLTRPQEKREAEKPAISITGNSPTATCAEIIEWAWSDDDYDIAVLACDGCHFNALLANPIAGALGAPVFSTKPNFLTPLVEENLCQSRPTKIILIDSEATAYEMAERLKRLPWKPDIIHAARENESMYLFSARLIEEGARAGLWNDEVAIISMHDVNGALALTPYLYAQCCPVVLMLPDDNDVARTMRYFEDYGSKRVIALDESIEHMVEIIEDEYDIEILRFSSRAAVTHLKDVTEFVWNAIPTSNLKTLLIASKTHTQWTELISSGAAAGHKETAIQFFPSDNLDEIVGSLRQIEDHSGEIDALLFIGEGLSSSDQKLLINTLND